MSKYDDVMRHLHPQVIIEKIEVPHDTARGSYSLQTSIARSHLEFQNILIDYVDHHMRSVIGTSLPPEYLLSKAKGYIGNEDRFNQALYIGMSGTDGGMVRVLNDIAEGFKNEAKEGYYSYVLDSFIDPLLFNEVVELMRELKNKLGQYAPQPFNYLEPEAMAANHKSILWQYIMSLQNYRNIWQY